jgi:hypothetical protein
VRRNEVGNVEKRVAEGQAEEKQEKEFVATVENKRVRDRRGKREQGGQGKRKQLNPAIKRPRENKRARGRA